MGSGAGPQAEIPLAAVSLMGLFAGATDDNGVRQAWASPLVERHLLRAAAARRGPDSGESVLYQKITMLLGFLPELC